LQEEIKEQGGRMNDLLDRIVNERDVFQKLLSKVPGFKGYIERGNRRAADKLLRETLASRFEELWQRISTLQTDILNQGGIEYMDDIESSAIKLRQFIDRIKTAAYGYAGLFDAIKVNVEELEQIYKYDLALVNSVDEVGRAIDNVEASVGSDGLPAAIRNLRSISQSCIDAFNKRSEVILGSYGADAGTADTSLSQPTVDTSENEPAEQKTPPPLPPAEGSDAQPPADSSPTIP
jgi:hypothetical protein